MMPDLGVYAGPVLAAYGISIALLALIVGISVRRYRRLRVELARVERGRDGNLAFDAAAAAAVCGFGGAVRLWTFPGQSG